MGAADPRSMRPIGLRVVRSALAWSTTTDAAAKGSVLVLGIVAARALDPEHFAQFVGFAAVMLLATAVWDLGLSPLLTREVGSGRVTTSQALRRAAWMRTLALPFWLLAFAAGGIVLAAMEPVGPATVVPFALGSLVAGARMVLVAVLQGLLAFRSAGVAAAVGRFASVPVALLALGLEDGRRLPALAVAVLVGEVTFALLTIVPLARHSRARSQPDAPGHTRLTFRASAPFAANSLMTTTYNRLDIVLVAALTTSFQAGLYAPASRLQDALLLLPASVGVVTFPIVAGNWSDHPDVVRRQVPRLMQVGFLITMPVAIVVAIFAPVILGVVLGEDYVGAAGPLRILVWSVVLSAMSAPLVAGLAGIGRAGDTTKVFAAAFVTALVAHLSLDWWWGATGAAVATLSREPVALGVAIVLAVRAGLLRTGAIPEDEELSPAPPRTLERVP